MKAWLFACILWVAVATAAAAQGTAPRSVWDSVYTEEQARRGGQLSAEHCAPCHAQTLAGAESARALVGDVFNGNSESAALGDLFDRIRASMPQDAPGSLSRQLNVDVVAYLLKAGQFPAGDKELVTESNALAQMKFVSNRPQP